MFISNSYTHVLSLRFKLSHELARLPACLFTYKRALFLCLDFCRRRRFRLLSAALRSWHVYYNFELKYQVCFEIYLAYRGVWGNLDTLRKLLCYGLYGYFKGMWMTPEDNRDHIWWKNVIHFDKFWWKTHFYRKN